MPSADMLKQLLDEFVEKEALLNEELSVINDQIAQLERRLEKCQSRLSRIGEDRQKVVAMKDRYCGAGPASPQPIPHHEFSSQAAPQRQVAPHQAEPHQAAVQQPAAHNAESPRVSAARSARNPEVAKSAPSEPASVAPQSDQPSRTEPETPAQSQTSSLLNKIGKPDGGGSGLAASFLKSGDSRGARPGFSAARKADPLEPSTAIGAFRDDASAQTASAAAAQPAQQPSPEPAQIEAPSQDYYSSAGDYANSADNSAGTEHVQAAGSQYLEPFEHGASNSEYSSFPFEQQAQAPFESAPQASSQPELDPISAAIESLDAFDDGTMPPFPESSAYTTPSWESSSSDSAFSGDDPLAALLAGQEGVKEVMQRNQAAQSEAAAAAAQSAAQPALEPALQPQPPLTPAPAVPAAQNDSQAQPSQADSSQEQPAEEADGDTVKSINEALRSLFR